MTFHTVMNKTCIDCGVAKSISEFYRAPRNKDGHRGQCKDCARAQMREYQKSDRGREKKKAWLAENPRSRTPEEIRRQRLWTWHRLTVEQFEALLAAQDGRCAVCKTDQPGGRGAWHVDHDHTCCPTDNSCGKCVRGLLCSRCNPMIGMAKDDPKILAAAVDYLVFGGVDA